jgi:hypothetical protein
MPSSSIQYLNLGCGRRHHPAWTNVDCVSSGPNVLVRDLKQGVAFDDNSFDVVYHSHVLEHFTRDDGHKFLKECHRVLRPDGVVRIAVPDLERIVRTYVSLLEEVNYDSDEWLAKYEWIILEMYDQCVRHRSGGDWIRYLRQQPLQSETFVIERCGCEAEAVIRASRSRRAERHSLEPAGETRLVRVLRLLKRVLRRPTVGRELLIKTLLGAEYDALQVGRFRKGGEVHLSMYDRYSLSMLMRSAGFSDIVDRTSTDSYIPDWAAFHLDTEPDGRTYKPDSLFMEARKPR